MDNKRILAAREKQALEAEKQTQEFKRTKRNSKTVTSIKQSGEAVTGAVRQNSRAVLASATATKNALNQLSNQLTSEVGNVNQAVRDLISSLESIKPEPQDDTNVVQAINELKAVAGGIPSAIHIPKQEKIDSVKVSNQIDYTKQFSDVLAALKSIDVKPSVNVDAPKVDLKGVISAVENLQKTLKNDLPAPVVNVDLQEVTAGLSQVVSTLNNLKFPVPNYVLPFKDINGKATQVQLDSSGNVPTSGGSGGTVDQGAAGTDPWLVIDEDKQGVSAYAKTLTAGDTITPSAGKRLHIVKSQILQNPGNSTFNLVTLSFASSIGAFFKCWVGSDSSVWIGAVDEALTIGLSGSDQVSVNIRYKEV